MPKKIDEIEGQIQQLESLKDKILAISETCNRELLEDLLEQEVLDLISQDQELLEAAFDDTSVILKLINKKLGILKGQRTKTEKREAVDHNIWEIRKNSMNSQRAAFKQAVDKGDLIHLKNDAENNRIENLLQHNYKGYYRQARFGNLKTMARLGDETLVYKNDYPSRNKKNQLIHSLIFDPGTFSEEFLHRLNIIQTEKPLSREEVVRIAAQNMGKIKDILATSVPLGYESYRDDGSQEDKYTDRVLFLQDELCKGRIAVSRVTSTLANTSSKNITRAEKNKQKTQVPISVYEDGEHFIRGQRYALDEETSKIHNLRDIRKRLSLIMGDMAGKETDFKTRTILNNIVKELDGKESFHIAMSNIHALMHVSFIHAQRDKNRIRGADNNLSKEGKRLFAIMSAIDNQLFAFEQKFELQENNLMSLHSECIIALNNKRHESMILNPLKKYYENYANPWKKDPSKSSKQWNYNVEPFVSFHNQIDGVLGTRNEFNEALMDPKREQPMKQAMKELFTFQRKILESYRLEHDFKLGKIGPEKVKRELGATDDDLNHPDEFFDGFRTPKMIQKKLAELKDMVTRID